MKLPGQTNYEAFMQAGASAGYGADKYPAFEDIVPERQAQWAAGEEASIAKVRDQPDWPCTPTGRGTPRNWQSTRKTTTSPAFLGEDLNGLP